MMVVVMGVVMLVEVPPTQGAGDMGVDRPTIVSMSDKHIKADPRQQQQRNQEYADRCPASEVPSTDCVLQRSHDWLNDDRWLGWLSNAY